MVWFIILLWGIPVLHFLATADQKDEDYNEDLVYAFLWFIVLPMDTIASLFNKDTDD